MILNYIFSCDIFLSSTTHTTSASTSTGTSMMGGRSRSNSWRGSATATRRACTILKEESEEELSSYLRLSSRQSSRYLYIHSI